MAQPYSVLSSVPWLGTPSRDLHQPPPPSTPAGDPLQGLKLHCGKLLVEEEALFSCLET